MVLQPWQAEEQEVENGMYQAKGCLIPLQANRWIMFQKGWRGPKEEEEEEGRLWNLISNLDVLVNSCPAINTFSLGTKNKSQLHILPPLHPFKMFFSCIPRSQTWSPCCWKVDISLIFFAVKISAPQICTKVPFCLEAEGVPGRGLVSGRPFP